MIRRIRQELRAFRGKSLNQKLEAACHRVRWPGGRGQFVELLENRRLLSSVIDVQFAPTGAASQTGAAVIGAPGDQWNVVHPSGNTGSGIALTTTAGSATTATLSYSINIQFSSNNEPFAGTPYANLMSSGIIGGAQIASNPGFVDFSGLTKNATYGLYLMSNNGGTFSINGTQSESFTGSQQGYFAIGKNYSELTATTNSSGALTISLPFDAQISGIQLQTISNIVYVDKTATGSNNGTSWANAYTSLQSALTQVSSLASASNSYTVEVAQGTYVPTQVDTAVSQVNFTSTNPTPTFVVPEGVVLEGGFAGTHAGGADPGTRNVSAYPTILSGKLPTPVAGYSNSWQVVNANNDDAATAIDGFTITGGNATGGTADMSYENVGGGLIVINGSPIVENDSFTADQSTYAGAAIYVGGVPAGAVGQFNNLTVTGNSSPGLANGPGGAVFLTTGADNFTGGTFTDNSSGGRGGAIFAQFGTVNVTSVNFNSNSATLEGGAICDFLDTLNVTNSTFTDNSANQGGAMFNNNTGVTMAGDTFTSNFTSVNPAPVGSGYYGNYGGGAVVDFFASLTASDTYFKSNYTLAGDESGHPANGGALAVLGATTTLEDNTQFVDNSSAYGGAFYVNIFSTVDVEPGVSFTGNTATIGGGAVDSQGVNPAFTECTFTNNSAPEGGAFYNTGANGTECDPTITGCAFNADTGTEGGAIYDVNANGGNADPTIDDDAFANCHASLGAVIANENCSAIIDGGNFTANSTNGGANLGGAIYDHDSNVTIEGDTTFQFNSATNGGAIADYASTDTITSATFTSNTDSGTGSGGAIYQTTGSTLNVSNTLFKSNEALGSGQSGAGGAIDDSSGSTTNASACVFDSNTVTGEGGAILVTGGSSLTVANCLFTGDIASAGGAIYAVGLSSSLTVSGSQFTGNKATGAGTDSGGAIEANSISPTLTDCSFISNTAQFGGAIAAYNDFCTITLNGCTFTTNTATGTNANNGYGGAIESADGNIIKATNCIFTGNTAYTDSGAVDLFEASAGDEFVDCVFNGDGVTNGNGAGAIGVYASSPAVLNSTFSNNTTETGGAAVEDTHSGTATFTNCILYGDGPAEITNDGTSSAIVTYSDVQGGHIGKGNVSGNPAFVNSPTNLELGRTSAALNNGTALAIQVLGVTTDAAGNQRVINNTVDMGAYESLPVLYVNVNTTATLANQNGQSWATAYASLQTALGAVSTNQTIEVAAGTYYPAGKFGSIFASFVVPNGVMLEGGFSGSASQTQPNPAAYPTILSGQLGPAGTTSHNSENVVTMSADGSTTVLDGFTITEGGDSDTNEGGGVFLSASNPLIENCTFINNIAVSGGALGIGFGSTGNNNFSASNPTVLDCTFYDNSAPQGQGGAIYADSESSGTITGCTFVGNTAEFDGGAIDLPTQPSIPITSCVFTDNSALNGGAIYVGAGSADVPISNCTFTGNSATNGGAIELVLPNGESGGTITITGSTFTDNTAVQDGGAMLSLFGARPIMTNCTYVGNSATDGGAVAGESGPTQVFNNCTFNDNVASDDGGALYNTSFSGAAANSCNFTGNTAGNIGGAIADVNNGATGITNGEFEDNSAASGGAVAESGSNFTIIVAASFLDNSASSSGGAMYLTNCSVLFESSNIFFGNTTPGDGGAIDSESSAMTIGPENVFGNNTATNGGAIFINNTDGTNPISITGDQFETNTATQNGGAIYNENSGATLLVGSTTFTSNNTTNGDGAAIYTTMASPVFTDDVIDQNHAGDLGGGAMLGAGSSGVTMSTCSFLNCSSQHGGAAIYVLQSSPTITNGTFAQNVTYNGNGGAIYDGDGAPIIDGSTFYKNTTNGNSNYKGGGAIFDAGISANANGGTASYAAASLSGDTFIQNTGYNGGAIYAYYSKASITDSTFTGDQSNQNGAGGGIYTKESAITLVGSTFIDESSGQSGGALDELSNVGPSLISDCFFIGNHANGSNGGGAASFFSTDVNNEPTVTILNTVFDGNTSAEGGGAIYDNQSSPTIFNCVFAVNVADNGGGAIDDDSNSSPYIVNCTFADNSCIFGSGGALYDTNVSNPTVVNCILTGDGPDEFDGDGSDQAAVSYSDVYVTPGNSVGGTYTFNGGMQFGDPNFVRGPGTNSPTDYGNLSPFAPSAAAYSGNYSATQALISGDNDMTDVAGNPRIKDAGLVDMGAYTYSYVNGVTLPVTPTPPSTYNRNTGGGPLPIPPIVVLNQPDLVPQNVTFTGAVDFNSSVTIKWTDQNIGNGDLIEPFSGASWDDAVYISTTPTLTTSSVLLGEEPVSTASLPYGDLTANSQTAGVPVSATFTLPLAQNQFAPGTLYFIVIANVDNTFAESNVQNNVVAAAQAVSVIPKTYDVDVHSPAPAATQNGLTWATAYGDLESVLNNVAEYGDTIDVAQGTYDPNDGGLITPTFVLDNGITLSGGFAGNAGGNENGGNPGAFNPTTFVTTLSTQVANFTVVTGNSDSSATVLENVTIYGGSNNSTSQGFSGGGLVLTGGDPMIKNVIFNDDFAYLGGAVDCYNSAPTFVSCSFTSAGSNNSNHDGGAVYLNGNDGTISAVFTNCTFLNNGAIFDGGAIYAINTSPTVTGTSFTGNLSSGGSGFVGGAIYENNGTLTATNDTFTNNFAFQGGAIYGDSNSTLNVTNCTFTTNTATSTGTNTGGGAICAQRAIVTLLDDVFAHNSAASDGGAINNLASLVSLVNCLVYGNTAVNGGGVYDGNNGGLSVTNSTFTANVASATNGGGAVSNSGSASAATVTNSILYGDGPNEINGTYTVTYSDVGTTVVPGKGNIAANPQFVNAATANYQLLGSSPAINAGNNGAAGLSGITTDLAGNARIVAGTVDMGAYENQTTTTTVFWTGGGHDSLWSDPLNWSIDAVPNANDVTTIGTGFTVQVNTGTFFVKSLASLSTITFEGGSLTLEGNSSIAPSLSFAGGGTLDVLNNELLINYGSSADPIAAIASALKTGYHGGAWNGSGIISSAVAAENASESALLYAVGYTDGKDGIVAGLSSGQIEILPTLAGDAKLAGNVVFGDFQLLAASFGSSGAWDAGNFTYGSIVNFGDFQELAQDFGAHSSLPASSGGPAGLANAVVDSPGNSSGSTIADASDDGVADSILDGTVSVLNATSPFSDLLL